MIAQRSIARTGAGLSELGFGGAPLGNLYREVPDQQASQTLDAAWNAGIRYFDTAPHYGLGLSERRIGGFLATKSRASFTISTKVGRLIEPNPHAHGDDLGEGGFAVPDDLRRVLDYSRDGIRRSVEESLARLGLGYLDIVYVHDPDDFVTEAIEQSIPALVELRDEGVIGAVGVGMNQWQAPLRMVGECDLDVVMIAGRWTLLDRSAAPLLQTCADRGVSVVAAAPFNSGLLARDEPPAAPKFNYQDAPTELVDAARQLARICRQHGVRLPHAAVQFGLREASVVSVVAGFGHPAHVDAAAQGFQERVPDAVFDEITDYLSSRRRAG